MKRLGRLLILFIVLVNLTFTAIPVSAETLDNDEGDKIIIGESFILPAGKTLEGRLIVFGGSAVIEENSKVGGDIVLTSSDITVSGNVLGNIISIGGGKIVIKESAKIEGDVIALASNLTREDGAIIRGDIIGSMPGMFRFDYFSLPKMNFSKLWQELNPLRKFLIDVFNIVIFSGIAALVVLVAPAATRRVSLTASKTPFLSGLFGLLTIVLLPFVCILLLVTLIFIPIIPLLILAVIGLIVWGWIALGLEIGRRMQDIFHLQWQEPLIAGLGVFVLSLFVNVLGWLSSCCLEFPVTLLLISVGLGSVILSKFGRQEYQIEIS